MTAEEIDDHINDVIAGQANCKRIIIWNVRQMRKLKKIEGWLKDEQRRINPIAEEA